jgi:ferritin-like protein
MAIKTQKKVFVKTFGRDASTLALSQKMLLAAILNILKLKKHLTAVIKKNIFGK